MQKEQIIQFSYLVKVMTGLLSVIAVCFIALALPSFDLSKGPLAIVIISLCVLFLIGLFPIFYKINRKMDELQKILHEHASVFAMTLFVSLSIMIGVSRILASNTIR